MKLVINVGVMVTGSMQYDPETQMLLPLTPGSRPFETDVRSTVLVMSKDGRTEDDTMSMDEKRTIARAIAAEFLIKAGNEVAKMNGDVLQPIVVAKGNEGIN